MGDISELIGRLRQLAPDVTRGPWQVVEDQHPWRLPPKPEWGRPDEKTGHHVERRIFTTWDHGQSHAPWPVINLAYGIGVDKPVTFIAIEPRDADWIALLSPDNVLAMADEIDRLKAKGGVE